MLDWPESSKDKCNSRFQVFDKRFLWDVHVAGGFYPLFVFFLLLKQSNGNWRHGFPNIRNGVAQDCGKEPAQNHKNYLKDFDTNFTDLHKFIFLSKRVADTTTRTPPAKALAYQFLFYLEFAFQFRGLNQLFAGLFLLEAVDSLKNLRILTLCDIVCNLTQDYRLLK